MLRKEYGPEPAKVLPLVEDQGLADLLIRVGHTSQFGAVRPGRQFHRSPSNTLKHIIVSYIGFFQHKLLIHINNLIKHYMFCNLVRPISVQAPPGTRVAGTLRDDPPYSHVSCDNVQLGLCLPYVGSRKFSKYLALICTCLYSGHVSIERIDSFTAISIGLALRRLEMRFKVRLRSVWTDAFSSLKEEALGPHLSERREVVWEGVKDSVEDVTFHTNVAYTKSRLYVGRKVRDVKALLKQCQLPGGGQP